MGTRRDVRTQSIDDPQVDAAGAGAPDPAREAVFSTEVLDELFDSINWDALSVLAESAPPTHRAHLLKLKALCELQRGTIEAHLAAFAAAHTDLGSVAQGMALHLRLGRQAPPK